MALKYLNKGWLCLLPGTPGIGNQLSMGVLPVAENTIQQSCDNSVIVFANNYHSWICLRNQHPLGWLKPAIIGPIPQAIRGKNPLLEKTHREKVPFTRLSSGSPNRRLCLWS
jgi:hypothetical protein